MGWPSVMRSRTPLRYERLDVVELCGGNERADGSPPGAATVGARKQVVLAPECDRPDRAFNGIGVEIDAAVVEEAGEFVPAREGIADRFGQGAAARERAPSV